MRKSNRAEIATFLEWVGKSYGADIRSGCETRIEDAGDFDELDPLEMTWSVCDELDGADHRTAFQPMRDMQLKGKLRARD